MPVSVRVRPTAFYLKIFDFDFENETGKRNHFTGLLKGLKMYSRLKWITTVAVIIEPIIDSLYSAVSLAKKSSKHSDVLKSFWYDELTNNIKTMYPSGSSAGLIYTIADFDNLAKYWVGGGKI